jgi:hypothetical protein
MLEDDYGKKTAKSGSLTFQRFLKHNVSPCIKHPHDSCVMTLLLALPRPFRPLSATAVPTSTGVMAAFREKGRAAFIHIFQWTAAAFFGIFTSMACASDKPVSFSLMVVARLLFSL